VWPAHRDGSGQGAQVLFLFPACGGEGRLILRLCRRAESPKLLSPTPLSQVGEGLKAKQSEAHRNASGASTKIQNRASSSYVGQGKSDFDRFVGHRNLGIFSSLDETEFQQSRHIGVNVRIVAISDPG